MTRCEMKEKFDHHANQCRGRAKAAAIGYSIMFVLMILLFRSIYPGQFFEVLDDFFVAELIFGYVATLAASFFTLRENHEFLWDMWHDTADSSVEMLNCFTFHDSVSIGFSLVPVALCGIMVGCSFMIQTVVFPIATAFHAYRYFRYKKMLAET